MPPSGTRYRIKTVARLTGIAPATIRAWERRHGIVAPQRTSGGQRAYSERDVATLHRIKAMLDTGLSIGEVCEALRGEPEVLGEVGPAAAEGFGEVCGVLTQAFVSLDRDMAERVLRPLLPLYPFEVTFERIFMPTLVRLGELWRQGEASVAAEHFGAAFVREKLISMLSAVSAPGQGRPRALLACPEGERHELGLLYLALRLSARGWATVYLGPDMPVEGLIEAMGRVKPGIVGLSLTQVEDQGAVLGQVERLCEAAGDTAVLVGGAALTEGWRGRLGSLGAWAIITDEDLNAAIRAIRGERGLGGASI